MDTSSFSLLKRFCCAIYVIINRPRKRTDCRFFDRFSHHRGREIDPVRVDALLGTAKAPRLTLSQVWDAFWHVTEDRRADMTRNQARVWANQRRLSMNLMIDAIGDIEVQEITPDDLLDFRDAMWQRVRGGQMQRDTANKRMGQAFNVLKTVNTVRRLGLSLSFDGLSFTGAENNTRAPFSDEWIRDRILAPGALDGLNTEARCILLGMVNTGYRPAEGAELRPEDIRLDTEIPHISINGAHRKLKTKQSERTIPLVGVSLEAFRQCPQGFPRYRDSSSLTATVNKYLREHGLRETPCHTFYGLRHSFEDRLLAANVDERIRRDLMGHKLVGRERYGAGARLEQLHSVLAPVAL